VLMSFIMVLYSSFLARSGVLGETSVHSFVDNGMFWHLLSYVLVFLALSISLLVLRRKEMPFTKKDEETYSREFWMFVGSIFLALSCFHLIRYHLPTQHYVSRPLLALLPASVQSQYVQRLTRQV